MKAIELINKRTKREKYFLLENGVCLAKMYDNDVHFLKNGKYLEINNKLYKDKNGYRNECGLFDVIFNNNSIIELHKENYYLIMDILNKSKDYFFNVNNNSKEKSVVQFENILDYIDMSYELSFDKIKENIILKNKTTNISDISFIINTNLKLEEKSDYIELKDNDNIVFTINKPFIIDSNGKKFNDIKYCLDMDEKGYILRFDINEFVFKECALKYPLIIDPTINNRNDIDNVFDTYITSAEPNANKNNLDILKVGIEQSNNTSIINRALLKFNLPTIGTGSQIINARMNLVGYGGVYGSYDTTMIDVHRITEDWTESTATWNNMYNKYDSRIDGWFEARRSWQIGTDVIYENNVVDITELVKKWYESIPNYGLMLMLNEEIQNNNQLPAFYSKNNTLVGDNPKPFLEIYYRNDNGIEDYYKYLRQGLSSAISYVNTYNGNLNVYFNVIETIGKRTPVTLGLVYNTNDVVLNNDIGLGKGYKFNYYQTLRHVTIDEIEYIEYVDEDGTIHYFTSNKEIVDEEGNIITESETNTYYDEDGLGYKIIVSNTDYKLYDKDGNILKFVGSGEYKYLIEIKDNEGNTITINYNQDNKIIQITDDNNEIVNISYNSDCIIVTNNNFQGKIYYSNGQINRVESRFGVIDVSYQNGLIHYLSDNGNRKLEYVYYNQKPYRIFRVIEYGSNDIEGGSITLNYNYSATTIIDHLGKAKTLTFNRNGNVVSTSSLSESNSLINAYGIAEYYGEDFQFKNKLVSSGTPLKHVKNLITNSGFEENNSVFSTNDSITLTYDNNNQYSGDKCLKIDSSCDNGIIYKEMPLSKGKKYTFSAFIKNSVPIKLILSYLDNQNNEVIEESLLINSNNDYYRDNITIEYAQNAYSNLFIKINVLGEGIVYLDNIQLEEGDVANNYNFIENSDFVDGITDWNLDASSYYDGEPISTENIFSREEYNTGEYALKILMNPRYQTSFNKRINISGHAGDLFTISFWYKNKGLYVVDGTDMYNSVIINFGYPESELGHCIMPSAPLNPNENEWQFFTESFIAEADYSYIDLVFFQILNANELLITNLFLYKDVREEGFDIDKYGNVISSTELDGKENSYSYNSNNKLIKVSTESGEALIYEYDNDNSNLVLNNILQSGLSTEFYYDSNNNPIKSRIIPRNVIKELNNNYLYSIRKKGTRKQLKLMGNNVVISESDYTCTNWVLEKVTIIENVIHDIEDEFGNITQETIQEPVDYYKIKNNIINDKYLTSINNNLLLSNYDSNYSLFILNKNDDNSYTITNKDGKNLHIGNNIEFTESNEDQFYFETKSNTTFVESDATYDNNSDVVKELFDNRMIGTKYYYNYDKKPIQVSNVYQDYIYTYNNKKQLTKIQGKDSKVEYIYNNQDLLSKIKREDYDYDYEYDDFDNVSTIKIGNNNLISSVFENNNGNLSSIEYGNGQTITYTYDEHDRIKTILKGNKLYNYYYDSNGNISKIKSNSETIQYLYDFAKKTNEYRFNNFIINYYYDSSDNIIRKKYRYDNNNSNIIFTYNDNGDIIQQIIDNNNYNKIYDNLGRITSKTIASNLEYKYNYIKNGKRNSYIIKNFENFNNKYSFKYNKMNNITHIYMDNRLIFKYNYDENNQLISEKDFINHNMKKYKYDKYGNIIYTKKYKLDDFSFIEKENYLYSSNSWKDLLVKYNNDNIMYDSIGNVIQVGSNKFFSWINGNELASYTDNDNEIYYQYDIDGNRISKTVNGVKTTYYTDDENVIYEVGNNKVIYYLRDENGELIGFEYNGTLYYYEKDLNDSIIGIYNTEGIEIAKYNYDSWGKTIDILDSNNNDISSNLNHIANINPYRFKSYYYDVETKLYYLGTRYYNPEWKRFISPDSLDSLDDSQDSISQYNLFVYCQNNPVNNYDSNGQKPLPRWAKIAIGAGIIAGLAIATACTGGTAGVILGAALNGAVGGAASGAVIGTAYGGITNGWSGALDGACNGFLSGSIMGAVGGAASSSLKIASGSVKIISGPKPHGSALHNLSMNSQAGKMVLSGKYSVVAKNTSLNKTGLVGSQRPDVIGIGKKGNSKIIEVVSKSQTVKQIENKVSRMVRTNKSVASKTIKWVKKVSSFLGKLFK